MKLPLSAVLLSEAVGVARVLVVEDEAGLVEVSWRIEWNSVASWVEQP